MVDARNPTTASPDALHPFWELYALVVLLYLAECLVWVPHSLRLVGTFFGRPMLLRPAALLSSSRGALALLSPLPWDQSFRTPLYELAVGKGITGTMPFGEPGAPAIRPSLPWMPADTHAFSAVDGHVMAADKTLFHCSSTRQAEALTEALEIYRHLEGKRAGNCQTAAEQFLAFRMDEQAGTKLRELQIGSSLLRGLTTLQWAAMLGLLPILFLLGASRPLWLAVLGLLLLLHLLLLFAFHRVHRQLFPDAAKERSKRLFLMALAPTTAMRAGHSLTLDALPRLHPLLLLAALGAHRAARRLALSLYRDACFPTPFPDGPAEEAATLEIFRQAITRQLEHFLRGRGIPQNEWLQAPCQEPGAHFYCPRCLASYARHVPCSACGRQTLQPFPPQGRHSEA